jgi:hypothetical protein
VHTEELHKLLHFITYNDNDKAKDNIGVACSINGGVYIY